MITTIKQFFESKLAGPDDTVSPQYFDRIELACAALMIEVMNSDHKLDERESKEFIQVLGQSLAVSDDDMQEIITLAKEEARQATSLYEFTRLINDGYAYAQKLELLENMWRIAFSDEKLDKYEDYLIRKISELIYVTHSDFIRTKLKVRNLKS